MHVSFMPVLALMLHANVMLTCDSLWSVIAQSYLIGGWLTWCIFPDMRIKFRNGRMQYTHLSWMECETVHKRIVYSLKFPMEWWQDCLSFLAWDMRVFLYVTLSAWWIMGNWAFLYLLLSFYWSANPWHPSFTYTFIQMHDYLPVEFVRYNNFIHRYTGEASDDDQRPYLGAWEALLQFLITCEPTQSIFVGDRVGTGSDRAR